MAVDKNLLSPCGLYCGVCSIYMAHRDDNLKFKERLANLYNITVEDVHCHGCMSDDLFGFCKSCPMRSCIREKGYEGCHQCDDFPCEFVDNFPIEVGRRVMHRAVPERRELGTEKWVEAQEKRYRCPGCDYPLFRGVKRCRSCGIDVDVD